jgi:hypothetical protein
VGLEVNPLLGIERVDGIGPGKGMDVVSVS